MLHHKLLAGLTHRKGATATSYELEEVRRASPAQLRPQEVHIDLYLLQRLPIQRLQPYALHQPLHSYPCDACHASAASGLFLRSAYHNSCVAYQSSI